MPAFHGDQLGREFALRALTPTTVARELGCRRDTIYRALRGDPVSARTAESILTLLDRRPVRAGADRLLDVGDRLRGAVTNEEFQSVSGNPHPR